ncbi:cation:proton antiporter family protein [Microbacterium halotolerans]|uniref:cation:proton antiporter family protein n=1 Tax=Microbacterium halotolerans TaxID=246613 RepID=UPI000E6A9E26|nr:cation:proton antiporter family protein [Microbacterium halotolerans]
MFTTTAALYLAVALAAGLAAVLLRLPPLIGFLATGFALSAAGVAELPVIEEAADLGVTLLLFTIGLKLDLRTLLRKEVWLTNAVHMVVSTAIGVGFVGLIASFGLGMLTGTGAGTWAVIGFALSFASTVFVVKVLDDRSDSTALYGRIAIGVLIMQDIAAVVFLSIAEGTAPSPWAVALVALIPGTWLLRRAWDRIEPPELQVLFGLFAALVPGYVLFEAVGLKGDLGALVMGVLLASHSRASDLSHRLLSVKDLLLVAFFVNIGLGGVPTLEHLAIAGLLLLLLPLQTVMYVGLLWWTGMRHRTSWLTALSMANYSEFGLIVAVTGASVGLISEEWLTVLAVAVACSFVVSAVLNRKGAVIAEWFAARMPRQDPSKLHPDDRPIDVGDAEVVVLGMGRVGRAALLRLHDEHGLEALGVEHDAVRVEVLRDEGLEVVQADATDSDFWGRVVRSGEVRLAVLAMPFHHSNLEALELLRNSGFAGSVAAIARYEHDVDELRAHGANTVFHLYGSAGIALADAGAEDLAES